MDSADDYILKLPKEIIFLIVTYVSKSWDIMQFLNAYPMLDYEITTVDLSCDYRIDLTQWLRFFKHDFTQVVSFNINNTYWIPVDEIKTVIQKMPNLTQLLVMDTELVADKENCLFLNKHCLKLETLAISINYVYWNKITADDLPSLCKTVYFHIKKEWVSMAETIFIHDSFRKFKLFLLFMDYNRYPQFATRHRKFGSTTYTPIVVTDCSRWEELLQNMLDYDLEKCNRIPFGVSDIKNIQKNEYSLDNIKLQEFSCADCSSFYVDCLSFSHKLEYDLLCSEKTIYLRKLAINFCVVFRDIAESFFNKNSIHKVACEDRAFQKIINNCSLIEELEIWDCKVYSLLHYNQYLPYDIDDNLIVIKQFIEELHCITRLKHLRKLSLVLPTKIAKHDFLEKILKECNKLEYLSIEVQNSHKDHININHLFTSISQTSRLKDLKIKYENLCVNSLLETLGSADSSKLQRLYLYTKKFIDTDPVKNFLEKNPQLLFFGIHNTALPIKRMMTIQNIMDTYKINRQKVFCVGTKWVDNSCITGLDQKQMFSPSIHRQDMVQDYTRICVYNYFSNTSSIRSTELFNQIMK